MPKAQCVFTRRYSAGNSASWTSALARRGWCACQATRTFSRCVTQAFETDTPRQAHRQASPTPSAGCSQFRSDAEAHWSVTLSVADADSVGTRTAELGGTVVSGPIDVPYSRVVQITDPQGASLTLSQFKMPE